MKLLSVQNVFALAVGIVGLAYLADASSGQASVAPAFGVTGSPALNVPNLFGLAAFADEMPTPDDFSDLLRVDLPDLDVTLDSRIGTQIAGVSTVRKIAFGQPSDVRVYSTPTGTYSTDGLSSVHVQYPGIEVAVLHPFGSHHAGGFVWNRGFGWVAATQAPARSIMTFGISPNAGGGLDTSGMDCAEQAGVMVCG